MTPAVGTSEVESDDDVDLGEYIDVIAVERRMDGDHTVALTPVEVQHAHALLEARGLSSQQIATRLGVEQRTVLRWRSDPATKPYALKGRPVTAPIPAPSPLGLLLEQASAHGNPKVRKLAERIEGALDDLRDLMAADVEREKARREVARLEAELRAAKVKLTGNSAPASAPKLCVDCARPVVRPPGQRGVLAKRCADCRAAAAA